MISKNIKPKKIASIVECFNTDNSAKNFQYELNKKILTRFLKLNNPTCAIYVSSVLSKFTPMVVDILKTVRFRSGENTGFSSVNPYINALEDQNVYLASEVVISQESKKLFKVSLDFYVVDEQCEYIKNNREILIPFNSVVYQVSDSPKFKAYKKDNVVSFIRTSKDMQEVEINRVGSDFYERKDENTLNKVKLIDNTNELSDGFIKAVKPTHRNKSDIETYISFDKKYISIPKGIFLNGFSLKIQEIDGTISDFAFEVYDLSLINPTLKGKVRSLWIGDKVYISETKA